jgi:imidazolonepropionase-like amidohydrolase
LLAITNGKLVTITRGNIERGTVLVDNGKIVALGASLAVPAGAHVIDAGGKIVTPGIIDAHAHVSIWEEGMGWEGDDVNELTDPVTPHLRAVDAINPDELGLHDAVSGGVTTVWSAPGSGNVIGGLGVTMKTYGTIMDKMILNQKGLKAAFGENPKRVYGSQKKMPSTRMGTAGVMREALVKAQNYAKKMERAADAPEKAPERDLRLEPIVSVLNGEQYMRAHAHRADDIMTAIRISEEFGFKLAIEHATEAHKIVDELARREVPIVVGPTLGSRGKIETRDKSWATPGICAAAGIKVCLMTDHPIIPVHFLPLCAGFAVKEGMTEADAFRAITLNPAELLGISSRVGSLEAGKDADIVIWDNHPMEAKGQALVTIIDGEVVSRKGCFAC